MVSIIILLGVEHVNDHFIVSLFVEVSKIGK